MPTIALAFPIPPEKYATWRTIVTSFAGERRAEYDASRRRLGVQRSTSWVQETPQGPIELLFIEATDPARFFEGLATSQEPFASISGRSCGTSTASTSPSPCRPRCPSRCWTGRRPRRPPRSDGTPYLDRAAERATASSRRPRLG